MWESKEKYDKAIIQETRLFPCHEITCTHLSFFPRWAKDENGDANTTAAAVHDDDKDDDNDDDNDAKDDDNTDDGNDAKDDDTNDVGDVCDECCKFCTAEINADGAWIDSHE